jgi:hypothetical protein
VNGALPVDLVAWSVILILQAANPKADARSHLFIAKRALEVVGVDGVVGQAKNQT